MKFFKIKVTQATYSIFRPALVFFRTKEIPTGSEFCDFCVGQFMSISV